MESPSTVASGISAPFKLVGHPTKQDRAAPPAGQAERARSGGAVAVAPVRLRDVAVGDLDEDVVALAPAAREVLGDRHRAMAPSGAADGDRQVRLALGH